MALADLVKMLDALSREELRELRHAVEKREREQAALDGERLPPEIWIARLEAAADQIREGYTDEEWAEVERAMNEEYVEPWDESVWKD